MSGSAKGATDASGDSALTGEPPHLAGMPSWSVHLILGNACNARHPCAEQACAVAMCTPPGRS